MSPMFLSYICLAIIVIDCIQASVSNSSLKQLSRIRRSDECSECGIAKGQASTPLIISGQIVRPPNKYPWVVGLVPPGESKTFCGGSIITEKFVLTASHCLRTKDATILKDEGGSMCQTDIGRDECLVDPSEMEVLFLDDSRGAVEEVYASPKYKADTPYAEDMGLIKLKEKIQCDDYKKPICMPQADHQEKKDAGTRMIITGWGVMDSETMETPEDLREIQVTVMDIDECDEYGWVPNHDKRAYCVTTKGVGSPCFGDSGGNLFTNEGGKNIVYGVATAVYSNKCDPNMPSLFTSVAPFRSWITEITGE